MRSCRRVQLLALCALLPAAIGGCGGDHERRSSSAPPSTATATGSVTEKPPRTTTTTTSGRRRLVRNPRRAAVERTVIGFVDAVERSDAAVACRLVGRPPGTLEGCARTVGIDLRALPSSNELSVVRIAFAGSRASAKLAGGQTFELRRAGRGWRISGLRS